MSEDFGSTGTIKAELVAQAVNQLIDYVGTICMKGAEIRSYFDVGIITYNSEAKPLFVENLSDSIFCSISALYNQPLNLEEVQRGGDPVWLRPAFEGQTSMCKAFKMARDCLECWVEKHQESYPPTIINITDGESTDGDPTDTANAIKGMSTKDGNVIVYNIHISTNENEASGIFFPDSPDHLPDDYAKMLFGLSSCLPEATRERIYQLTRKRLNSNARAFVFNANHMTLVKTLNVGTPLNMLDN